MDYELKIYKRKSDLMAPDDFKEISPLGTSPTITDGKVTLSESNAIIDYILDKKQDTTMRPSWSSPERTKYLFWFHAAQGSLMPILSVDGVWRITLERIPFIIRPIVKGVYKAVQKGYVLPRLETILNLASQQLESTPYFAGDYLTAADITLIYPLESCLTRYPELAQEFPSCKKWLDRMHERPQFKAALEKAGDSSVVAEL